jgi:hypothetical protein
MPKLARFSTPARQPDRHPAAWSRDVQTLMAAHLGPRLPQFYDPTKENTPAGTPEPMVLWTAFPARLRSFVPSERERFKLADRDRSVQDEYCEWAVRRNDVGKIIRVTFTTELPEYWEHLFKTDRAKLLRLYRKFVSPEVELADLRGPGGYRRTNRWNRGANLAHLQNGPNNLAAAVDLVARATVRRIDDDGDPVINQQELVACAGLGDPLRNSDPQIASAVNVAAGEGDEIGFADPPGLHLGRPRTTGLVTPDGADPARFWKIERGDAEHTLRARFEVPETRDYVVGDIKSRGRPVEFGGQIAERVPVWIKVRVKAGNHKPKPRRCGEP